MDEKNFIKENWGILSLNEIVQTLNLTLLELLKIAYDLNLFLKDTPNFGRRWSEDEEEFLKRHSKYLTVRHASNLLYRSHYATYQRIKYLGLNEMVNKK